MRAEPREEDIPAILGTEVGGWASVLWSTRVC